MSTGSVQLLHASLWARTHAPIWKDKHREMHMQTALAALRPSNRPCSALIAYLHVVFKRGFGIGREELLVRQLVRPIVCQAQGMHVLQRLGISTAHESEPQRCLPLSL